MTIHKIVIHNVETNEIIERDMNEAEIAHFEAVEAEIKAEKIQKLEKENARQSALAKLAALGLTEDEIAAL